MALETLIWDSRWGNVQPPANWKQSLASRWKRMARHHAVHLMTVPEQLAAATEVATEWYFDANRMGGRKMAPYTAGENLDLFIEPFAEGVAPTMVAGLGKMNPGGSTQMNPGFSTAMIRRKMADIRRFLKSQNLEEDEHWEVYEDYSGKKMYGAKSALAIEIFGGALRPGSKVGNYLSKHGMVADNLGMGWIYYLEDSIDQHPANQIPKLTDDSTWEDVVDYLEWLYDSPFGYHLEDDLDDIQWGGIEGRDITKAELDILKDNSDILWEFSDDESGTNIWEAYMPDTGDER